MTDDVVIQYYVEQQIAFLAQYSEMQQPLQAVAVVENRKSTLLPHQGGVSVSILGY